MQHSSHAVAAALVVLLAGVLPATAGATAATAPTHQQAELTCEYPATFTDSTDTEVTLESDPGEIVVLGASAAQTVWEIGAREEVVATSRFATYLDGAGDLPVVAQGIGSVDYEAILAQDPDLVIIAGNSYGADVAAELRSNGVTTYRFGSAGNLSGISEKIVRTGRLTGACSGASERAAAFNATVERVREATADVQEPSILYLAGSYAAGPSTFIGSVMQAAGTTNVAANSENASGSYGFFMVSDEFVLQQDPQWLLTTYSPGGSPAQARAAVQNSTVLSQTRAAEQGQVIAVNTNYLNQPAPRIVQPLTKLVSTIHPEAWAAANETTTTTSPTTTPETSTDAGTSPATTTGSAGTTDGTDGTTAATATTESGGQPGLGPLVGLAGLAAALGVLVVRRD